MTIAAIYAIGCLATALHLCGPDGHHYGFAARAELIVWWPGYLVARFII